MEVNLKVTHGPKGLTIPALAAAFTKAAFLSKKLFFCTPFLEMLSFLPRLLRSAVLYHLAAERLDSLAFE